MRIEKQPLVDFPIIRCVDGEKILLVQRQHPIVLLSKMILQIILFLLIPAAFIFVGYALPNIAFFNLNSSTLFIYIILTSVSVLLVVEIFTFMTWYYYFFIITNKEIVEKYCFRILGPYSESVFGEHMHVQDIARQSPNLIYDFLKIQDVLVYFHKLEREEPFVFRTPQNSQEIEDLIENLINQSNPSQKAEIK